MSKTSIGAAWLAAVALVFPAASIAAEVAADLAAAIAGPQRSAENRARDTWRHPAQTLGFFGIRPDMTVVEISPGGGWYTEILAPYLREEGKLYAAAYPADVAGEDGEYYRKSREAFDAKLAAAPAVYDRVTVTDFMPPSRLDLAPAGSADLVLTFRNMHNWITDDRAEVKVMEAAFKALKPGGVLGIVEHRTDEPVTREQMVKGGYMPESALIAAAESAGFKLEAKSEVNANPKDTHAHPEGVWTLPPTLALEDKDRGKYLAIGESDRITLRFRKPAQ
jgi:predicted methyltransferase